MAEHPQVVWSDSYHLTEPVEFVVDRVDSKEGTRIVIDPSLALFLITKPSSVRREPITMCQEETKVGSSPTHSPHLDVEKPAVLRKCPQCLKMEARAEDSKDRLMRLSKLVKFYKVLKCLTSKLSRSTWTIETIVEVEITN